MIYLTPEFDKAQLFFKKSISAVRSVYLDRDKRPPYNKKKGNMS